MIGGRRKEERERKREGGKMNEEEVKSRRDKKEEGKPERGSSIVIEDAMKSAMLSILSCTFSKLCLINSPTAVHIMRTSSLLRTAIYLHNLNVDKSPHHSK